MIRKYTEQDEKTIVSMTFGKYAEELKEYSRDKIMIAEYEGNVTGYSYTSLGAVGYYFVFVYVFTEYRRRGIGTELYSEAEARCLKEECKEIFSNYFEKNGTDQFVRRLTFSYTTSSDILKFSGSFVPEKEHTIRQCKEEDYLRFQNIWSRGSYEMHKRIGLPVEDPLENDETYREQYCNDVKNSFALEIDEHIIGVGSITGNRVSCLAVDMSYNNCGYGTALTIFLTNEILKRGNKEAYITCETGNDNALHIYEKIGYKKLYTDYWAIKKLNKFNV